jgi:hypothetical protein
MILIGQDNIHLTVARKVYQGPQDAPIATKTHLGWILHGPVQQKNDIKAYTFHICHHEYPDDDLHEIVKRSFTTEAFGVNLNCWKANKDEARAQEIMKKALDVSETDLKLVFCGVVMTLLYQNAK